jgi:hypothetical protein
MPQNLLTLEFILKPTVMGQYFLVKRQFMLLRLVLGMLFVIVVFNLRCQHRTTPSQKQALEILLALTDLINQAVGDALSDMLLVEAVLTWQGKSLEKWDSDYTDLPSRQEKVKVANRSAFVPIKADTELSEPKELQEKINEQVSKFSKGRAFVRYMFSV